MTPTTHSEKYRRTPEGGRRQITVKEALEVLASNSKDSRAQAMVKNLTEHYLGSDAGQRDKAETQEHDSPGTRSAKAADPNFDGARD